MVSSLKSLYFGTPVSKEGIVFDVRVGQPTFGDGTNESSGFIPLLSVELLSSRHLFHAHAAHVLHTGLQSLEDFCRRSKRVIAQEHGILFFFNIESIGFLKMEAHRTVSCSIAMTFPAFPKMVMGTLLT